MARTMSPRARRFTERAVAVAFVIAMALLCWHDIAESLGQPISAQLNYFGELPRVTGGSAHNGGASDATVQVQLTHVSSQLQWLIALSAVIGFTLGTAVGLVLGLVWVRTGQGRPFSRSVAWSLGALAILVAVLGTFEELVNSWVAMREAFEAVGNSEFGDYGGSGIYISGIYIFVALGIGMLSSAFAIGARLTKETDGLV